jgi:hypothetical protein
MNFKRKALEMFLSGPYCDFPGIKGGQRAAAKLLGCSQTTVCKRSGIEISPIKAKKRQKRNDSLEISNPAAVTVIINYWVILG